MDTVKDRAEATGRDLEEIRVKFALSARENSSGWTWNGLDAFLWVVILYFTA